MGCKKCVLSGRSLHITGAHEQVLCMVQLLHSVSAGTGVWRPVEQVLGIECWYRGAGIGS